MSTADSIFLYVAPFRYPNTSCGVLFSPSLELDGSFAGVATPFDSGGLLGHVERPDPSESPRQYLDRHELPLDGHRRYLERFLSVGFQAPREYLDSTDRCVLHPLGLTGGDCRRWTQEVRILHHLPVKGNLHLQAVFVPRAIVAADVEIEELVIWSQKKGVDVDLFDRSREASFRDLQQQCLDYIERQLY